MVILMRLKRVHKVTITHITNHRKTAAHSCQSTPQLFSPLWISWLCMMECIQEEGLLFFWMTVLSVRLSCFQTYNWVKALHMYHHVGHVSVLTVGTCKTVQANSFFSSPLYSTTKLKCPHTTDLKAAVLPHIASLYRIPSTYLNQVNSVKNF